MLLPFVNVVLVVFSLAMGSTVHAEVDDVVLGKSRSLSAAPSISQASNDEYIVGSNSGGTPMTKQKYFLVTRVIQPALPTDPIESVKVEAVFSKATQIISWCELQDDRVWRQGWL